jgi:hypothetical protein
VGWRQKTLRTLEHESEVYLNYLGVCGKQQSAHREWGIPAHSTWYHKSPGVTASQSERHKRLELGLQESTSLKRRGWSTCEGNLSCRGQCGWGVASQWQLVPSNAREHATYQPRLHFAAQGCSMNYLPVASGQPLRLQSSLATVKPLGVGGMFTIAGLFAIANSEIW